MPSSVRASPIVLRRWHLLALLIAGITAIAFCRLCAADWTWWDDGETIHHNPKLNPPSAASLGYYWSSFGEQAPMGLYVPVTYSVWAGLAELAARRPDVDGIALDPAAFHTANVAFHVIAATIVFLLLRLLVRRDWPAVAGALLFALHPVQVETVAWISGGKDLLCGLFSLAALWQYVLAMDKRPHAARRQPWQRWTFWCIATLLLLAAMLSKPTAIIVPLMAGTIDRFLLHRPWRRIIRSLWPWLTAMIPCAIIAAWSQPAPWSSPLPIWMRPAIAADAIVFYIHKLLLPIHLCPDYGRRTIDFAAMGRWELLCLIPAIALLTWLLRRRMPIALVAGLLWLLPLLPVLGLIPFDFQYISTTADHYLYVAMFGPALLLAALAARIQHRHRHIQAAAAIVITIALLALGVRSYLQEAVWQDNRTLFEHTLAVNPASFIACDLLGFDHLHRGMQLAAASARAAQQQDPMASALSLDARDEEATAADYYQRALNINPLYVPSLFNLAIAYDRLHRPVDARQAIDRIVELQPLLPPGLQADPIGLARQLIHFGDFAGAVDWLDGVLRRDPHNRQAMNLCQAAINRMKRATTAK